MLIGLIIYGDLSQTSGGYLYDRQLVNHLQAQGDEVRIIALPWKNYATHLMDNLRPRLKRMLLQTPFDVLLQDELNHPSLFWLNGRLRPHITYPLISIVHHLRSSEQHPQRPLKLYRSVERKYLNSVDGFIVNSKTTRETVLSLSGECKPHVIAYPAADHLQSHIDPEAFRERAFEPGPLRLLFVGNVIPRKGLHLLIAALADLSLQSWRLDIIGDAHIDEKYRQMLRETAEAYHLSSNITWHGRVSDQALQDQVAKSHILVMPSTYEGFGIVYLEAMRFGLPAIGSTIGAAHEIINDRQNGYLVSPYDKDDLAKKIKKLHEDRHLLAGMGCGALQYTQAHPTWEASMEKARQFLLQMADRSS